MAANKARKGKTLGLAGRVALIACVTAIAGTLMQWTVTPFLLRNSFDRARLQYSYGAAQKMAMLAGDAIVQGDTLHLKELTRRMAQPLPGGEAAILSPDGKVIAGTPRSEAIVSKIDPALVAAGSGVVSSGDRRLGIFPIRENGKTLG